MTLKEPKKIISNLFKKYAKLRDNVVYAEKLFIINTIINSLFKDVQKKPVNKSEIMYYGEVIDKYLKDELDVSWKDGKIVISELANNDEARGEQRD